MNARGMTDAATEFIAVSAWPLAARANGDHPGLHHRESEIAFVVRQSLCVQMKSSGVPSLTNDGRKLQ
jgi:hypothetical protein